MLSPYLMLPFIEKYLAKRRQSKYCHALCSKERLRNPIVKIGEGSFCDALKARRDDGEVTVRLFEFSKGSDVSDKLQVSRTVDDNVSTFEREIVVGMYLAEKISGFPKVLTHGSNKERGYIISEYVPGENLANATCSEGELLSGMVQVGGQLDAMHRFHLYHGDITPNNIIAGDQFQIIDFGSSTGIDDLTTDNLGIPPLFKGRGAPCFMAPEIIKGHYSHKSEVFGLASSIVYALTETTPYIMLLDSHGSSWNCFNTWFANPDDVRTQFIAEINGLDPKLLTLLDRSLKLDPSKRPLFPEFTYELEEIVG